MDISSAPISEFVLNEISTLRASNNLSPLKTPARFFCCHPTQGMAAFTDGDKTLLTLLPLIVLVFGSLCLLLTIFLTSHSMYILCYQGSSRWIHITQKYQTLFIMVSYTLCTCTQFLLILSRYFFNSNWLENNWVHVLFFYIKDISYWIGRYFFYVLLVNRVLTPFDLGKVIFYSLRFIIFISAIAIACYLFLLAFFNQYSDLWRTFCIILVCNGVVLSVFVWIIYIKETKQTLFGIDPTTSLLAETNVIIMVNIVAKHGLLFGIAIIFNPGYLIISALSSYDQDGYYSDLYALGGAFTQSLEGIINVLVLWLLLRKNYDIYIRLCRCCHISCAKCCFKNVDSRKIVENPYKKLPLTQQAENAVFLTSRKMASEIEKGQRMSADTLRMSTTSSHLRTSNQFKYQTMSVEPITEMSSTK